MMGRIAFLVLIAAALTFLVRACVIEGIYVASASMEPTLHQGAKFFLEKVSIRFRPVRRGDVIVFPSPAEGSKDLIKRVIAVGGDEIEIRAKDVYLNGRKLEEAYVKHTRAGELLDGDDLGPMSVPAGMAFVMGDNRDESGDSRDWKDPKTGSPLYFVPLETVKGRILRLY